MQLITPIIAVLGFVLSLINSIVLFCGQKMHLAISFDSISANTTAKTNTNETVKIVKVKFTFANKSRLPISVSRIRMVLNNTYYDVDIFPYEVMRISSNNKVDRVIETNQCPISLSALGASSNYFAFLIPESIFNEKDKTYRFQFFTTRGEPIESDFEIKEEKSFKSKLLKTK